MSEHHQIYYWGLSLAELSKREFQTLSQACNQAEHMRAEKFVFEKDRISYLAAHGLLRFALSHCRPSCFANEWAFISTKYGKPVLSGENPQTLKFNLSHCQSRVVCMITHDLECGIDVEPLARMTHIDRLSNNCLSQAEMKWLLNQSEKCKNDNFLRFWTLKEAVSKALGLGLNIPFSDLEFHIESDPVIISTPENIENKFWLHQFSPDGKHIEALALKLEISPVKISFIQMEFNLSNRKFSTRALS